MNVDRPTLHRLAAAALKDLESKGLKPRPEDVVWLQDAASRIRAASRRRVASLVDWPVPCGGALLYPMSMAAYDWWRELPYEVRINVFVQGFVCAHSHEPDVLKPLADPGAVKKAALRWATTLTASPLALSASVQSVWPEDNNFEIDGPPDLVKKKKSADTDSPVDYGVFALMLCKKHLGTTPQYWLWEVSIETAITCWDLASESEETGVSSQEIEMHGRFRLIKMQIEKEITPCMSVPERSPSPHE